MTKEIKNYLKILEKIKKLKKEKEDSVPEEYINGDFFYSNVFIVMLSFVYFLSYYLAMELYLNEVALVSLILIHTLTSFISIYCFLNFFNYHFKKKGVRIENIDKHFPKNISFALFLISLPFLNLIIFGFVFVCSLYENFIYFKNNKFKGKTNVREEIENEIKNAILIKEEAFKIIINDKRSLCHLKQNKENYKLKSLKERVERETKENLFNNTSLIDLAINSVVDNNHNISIDND